MSKITPYDIRYYNDFQNDHGVKCWITNIYASYCRVEFENELADQIMYYDDLRPIPITPEVLENAGFYKLTSVANKWVYKFSDEIYCSFYFHDGIHHFKWCSNFLVKIKSFHHLQNIIYDLTGIELTLNK